MNDAPDTRPTTVPPTGERFGEPAADRPPTPEEEAAAERASADVDLDAVAEHYEEMTEIGRNVKGEGDIDPTD